jgi:hypothetical protein
VGYQEVLWTMAHPSSVNSPLNVVTWIDCATAPIMIDN